MFLKHQTFLPKAQLLMLFVASSTMEGVVEQSALLSPHQTTTSG